MRRAVLELKGTVHGRLTVLAKSVKPSYWRCLCSCGQETDVRGSRLNKGITKSCGCIRTTHGHTAGGERSGTYQTWAGMVARCKETTGPYADVTCDPRWQKFPAFLKDLGDRPEGKTLDRINPFKGYEKTNCQWASDLQQASNKRKAEHLSIEVGTRLATGTPAEWVRYLQRITNNEGWTVKQLKACLKVQTLPQIIASVHPQGLTIAELLERQRVAAQTEEQREKAARLAHMEAMIASAIDIFR